MGLNDLLIKPLRIDYDYRIRMGLHVQPITPMGFIC
jgi:hypothetical protein